MEHHEVVRRRRMVRAFRREPIANDVLDAVLAAGLRGPSAGNSAAIELVVLEGASDTARYWDETLPVERRADFPWPGLLDAPVLVLVAVDPGAYVARYAESDKAATGLGVEAEAWPVPYWFVDGGAAVMAVLYAAVDAGLGALMFGAFEHEPALKARFGIPAGQRLVATIALGHPAPDRPSKSAGRVRRPDEERIHRSMW